MMRAKTHTCTYLHAHTDTQQLRLLSISCKYPGLSLTLGRMSYLHYGLVGTVQQQDVDMPGIFSTHPTIVYLVGKDFLLVVIRHFLHWYHWQDNYYLGDGEQQSAIQTFNDLCLVFFANGIIARAWMCA